MLKKFLMHLIIWYGHDPENTRERKEKFDRSQNKNDVKIQTNKQINNQETNQTNKGSHWQVKSRVNCSRKGTVLMSLPFFLKIHGRAFIFQVLCSQLRGK
jgi:hypothetical protein